MGVTTTKTNKPLNPRGNDQSPLAYNRAKLYSGKALDFDGVNDDIETNAVPLPSAGAVSFYYQADATGGEIAECGGSTDDFRITINSLCGFYTGAEYRVSTSGLWPIDDKFHFVVLTWGDFGTKFYLNGQFLAENTNRPADFSSVPTTLYIGARNGSSNFLNGQIAGFKIFNTALTAAQVADLYNNPEKVVPTGVDNTALKLWLPMMEGAGTTAYNGAPDALGSELVTNGDFDTDSDWTKEGSWTISGGQASISSSTNDRLYQSITLDANKKYLLSINVISISTASIRFRFGGNGSAANLAEITTTGVHNFVTEPISGTSIVSIFAVSGASATIDDISVKEISNNGTISGATWTHGIGSPVGQTSVIDWNKHTLDGINEVLIPQGLTAGRDLLGNLFENVRKQGALNLDGNSWAEVHDNASVDITDAITLEAWIWYLEGDADWAAISKYQAGATAFMMFIYPARRVNLFANGGSRASSNTNVLSNNDWNHVVITYDKANIRIYINGSEDNSAAYTDALTTTAEVLEIGRYYASNAYATDGSKIAQPRIYNRALTAEEVQRNYNAGKNIYTN